MNEPPQDQASLYCPWRPWQCAPEYFGEVNPGAFPYAWKLLEIWREGWEHPQVVVTNEIPPEFNVYGLWWRPWPLVHPTFDGP